MLAHSSTPTEAFAFDKREYDQTMFSSFDIPAWTIPLSAITDPIVEQYKHMFTSFEVPDWMVQGVRPATHAARTGGAKDTPPRSSPAA
jgi:hypothetical protein